MPSETSISKLCEILKDSQNIELNGVELNQAASKILTIYLAYEARRMERGEYWSSNEQTK